VAAERLSVMGATDVVFTLSDARDRILKALPSRLEEAVAPARSGNSLEPVHV
jgi:hypothetical protein